jgi:hypothetical protein
MVTSPHPKKSCSLSTLLLVVVICAAFSLVGGRQIAVAVHLWLDGRQGPSWTNENPYSAWRGHVIGFTEFVAFAAVWTAVASATILERIGKRTSYRQAVAAALRLYFSTFVFLNIATAVFRIPVLHTNPLEARNTLDTLLGLPPMHLAPMEVPGVLFVLAITGHLLAAVAAATVGYAAGSFAHSIQRRE